MAEAVAKQHDAVGTERRFFLIEVYQRHHIVLGESAVGHIKVVATKCGVIVVELHILRLCVQSIAVLYQPCGQHRLAAKQIQRVVGGKQHIGVEGLQLVEGVLGHFLQGVVLEAEVTSKQWILFLDLLGGTLDALHADLVDGTIAGLISSTINGAFFLPLYKNILSISAVL